MNYLRIAVLISALLAGAGGGIFIYQGTVVASCGRALETLKTDKCPTAIRNGFAAAQLTAATKTIEYRDRTIPVIVHDGAEDAARAKSLQAQIAALTTLERTNACATSPAIRLRREQLCSSVGGPDCSPPNKTAR